MTIPVENYATFPNARPSFPPSSPSGPAFPPPLQNPVQLQPRHGHFEPIPMPVPRHDECPQPFRGMPVEEGIILPFPAPHFPFNGYPSPEFGAYFPTHPPEHFVDYSFAFDPYRNHQGRPPYPIILGNGPIHNSFYPYPPHVQLPHPHPQPPSHMPDIRPQPPFDYPPPPPGQFFYPSPPQLLLTPPMPLLGENVICSNGAVKKGNNRKPLLNNSSPGRVLSQPRKPSQDSSLQMKQSHRSSSNLKQGNLTPIGVPRSSRRISNTWLGSNRSPLLEQFRNNRDQNWQLKTIFGHIIEFSGDQHGSRFIQQELEGASDEEKTSVFAEIVPHKTDELIRDVFGNYVIQKFFEFGTKTQKDKLVKIVEEQVVNLSIHIYGCRVVQKALELISVDQQSSIIRCLNPHILQCIKDAHGNHVVQKLVEVVPSERLTFLPIICDNILELSTHPYGCRVLQRCLEHLPRECTRSLLESILCFTIELMKNQYGESSCSTPTFCINLLLLTFILQNYVIQFILEFGQDHDKAQVLCSVQGHLIELSRHKYASNVCEKALVFCDPQTRERLIDEIMVSNLPNGESPILSMAKDQYANYVLQRALTLSDGPQRDTFFNCVRPLLSQLRKLTTTYSRPLVSLERLMDKHFGKQAPLSGNRKVPGVESQSSRPSPRRSL